MTVKWIIHYPIQYNKNCWVRLLSNYNIKNIRIIYTSLDTCLMYISRFSLRTKVTLRQLKLHFYGADVVEWSRALDIRLSQWCRSVSMVWVQIRLLIDFFYVYMTGCVKCHVYFSTFVFANESWFFLCRVLSFILYWFGMVPRTLTIPERWQVVGMHNKHGFSHRRVADHFRVNHSIIVRLMQHFRQTGNVTDGRGKGRSVQLVHLVVI